MSVSRYNIEHTDMHIIFGQFDLSVGYFFTFSHIEWGYFDYNPYIKVQTFII